MFIGAGDYNHPGDVPAGEGRFVDVPVLYYDGTIGDISDEDLPSMPNPTSDYFNPEICESGFIALQPSQSIANATDYLVIWSGPDGTGLRFYVKEDGKFNSNASSIMDTPWSLSYHSKYGYLIIGANNRGNPWDEEWFSLQPVYKSHAIAENAIYPFLEAPPPTNTPVFDYYGWTDGDDTYHTTTLTVPVKKEGWHLTVDLRLRATLVDAGQLLAGWYKGSEVQVASQSYTGAVRSVCPIDNSTEGTFYYQGVAFSIIDGVERSVIGSVITVNVVDWDYDDYDPDTGGDAGGIITPGIVVPDPVAPETPTLTFVGEDATYLVGDAATPLVCTGSVTDGGTLTYEWYDGSSVVATGTSFTPPTDEVGVKSYYCVVTNTLDGYTASEYSTTVTITVEAAEEKGFCRTSFSIGVATGLCLEGNPNGGAKV